MKHSTIINSEYLLLRTKNACETCSATFSRVNGCAVSTTASGREALALFESREFDAVFTDVGMPGMSGWDLAGTIRDYLGPEARMVSSVPEFRSRSSRPWTYTEPAPPPAPRIAPIAAPLPPPAMAPIIAPTAVPTAAL
ncbi:MAG: response regulator [Pyrinomonadaceae bacterium]|nr:response regulator [Pyrinomonadaceae bacterium]